MIIRKDKRQGNFTQISNKIALNTKLSLGAKGLMLSILAHSDDFKISIDTLARLTSDKKTKVMTCIKELESQGFIEKHKILDNKKIIRGYEWIVREEPEILDLESIGDDSMPF